MKRAVTIFMIACIVIQLLTLTSCGKASNPAKALIGTWEETNLDIFLDEQNNTGRVLESFEIFDDVSSMLFPTEITFYTDGSFVAIVENRYWGNVYQVSGSYSIVRDGSAVELRVGKNSQVFPLSITKSGKLLSMQGAYGYFTFEFEKR